jgi:hypothetical protein
LFQRGGEFVDACWPDDPGDFASVVEEDKSRPELDAKRAAESASGSVFDLDVLDRWMGRESRLGGGRCELAMTAPVGAELDDE